MANNAINAFGMVLDNSSELEKEIRTKMIELLGINSKDEHLTEYIQECVSHFNVSNAEHNYIENIRNIIDEELSKIKRQKKENGIVDYSLISQNLINRLRELKPQDINLDEDFKTLATQLPNKFPKCGISQEQFFNHFNRKKEPITQMIQSYNKVVIDSLIKLAPQLLQELKKMEISKNIQSKQPKQEVQNVIKTTTKTIPNSNMNLYETIEKVRKQLYETLSSYISKINSTNPFNEIKPLTVNDFQQELNKYNVSVDKSYIKGVVSQINLELGRQLLNKAKENILKSIIISSNDTIKFLTAEDLIENYGIPNTCVNEIMDYVNNGITRENKKRKSSIQNKQMITNSQDLPLKDADNKENRNDLFTKYPGFKRLYECFMELADTEIQKDAIEQIMKFGKFNNFKLNSMLSNEKYSQKTEMERRITFSEMVLYDKNLFFYLVNHGLNVFHGTKTDALQTILSKGLFSSAKLNEEGIKLTTGEEYTTNMLFQANAEKRNFVSLTDNFNNAASYADFPYEEQTEYAKKYYGKDLKVEKNIPIIICFSNTDIEQKYGKSLVMVKSTCNEIGINSSINSSDIKCIITSYDKMEYVKSLVAPYKIDVLGYNYNNTFQKRLINDKKEKFYTILNSDIVVDEQEFENCKARIKEKLKESSRNNITEHLDKDLSMMAASTLKNDLALDLIEQYNNGIMVTPIMASNLINKYNINEEIAEQLASEINAMVKLYVQEKEKQKNDTPYVLDDYNEEKEEMLQSHR